MPYRNGVRDGRSTDVQRCPMGKVLQRGRKPELPEFMKPGPCTGCDVMVHAPSRQCGCALLRRGLRVCRRCAIGYDYLTQGWTKIDDAPFTPEAVELIRELWDRGAHIAALEPGPVALAR